MSPDLSPQTLLDISKQYGTPLYVYHTDRITKQYQTLVEAFKGSNTKFFYACKALTNINILKHIREIGCQVDCSSINEVKLALHAEFQPQQVLYTSNGISFEEIEDAAAAGVHINIDSLSNLEKFGKKFGNSYPVGIRLRPNIMAGGNLKIATGHDKSKFGIGIDLLEKIIAVVNQYDIQISNLHIHTGSEISDADVFVKGIEVIFELIPHFKHLKSIDLGGGFKVAYKKEDPELDIELLAKKVKAAFDSHPVAKGLEIWFEPGKYLVSASGYFLTQVNVLKQTPSHVFAGINSGFNHLIRPMFYDAYHEIENISNPTGEKKNYAVTGYICETDTFAWDRPIATIHEGDVLAFYNVGAYGFEMSSNYNSRFKPAEVMIKNGDTILIRKRDEFEDLLRNQVILP